MTFDEILDWYVNSLEGDIVTTVEADAFLKLIKSEHPEALVEWLESHLRTIVASSIQKRLKQQRHKTIAAVTRSTFAEAAAEAEAGDTAALSVFAMTFTVDAANTHRPLGAMTATDLRFAADNFVALGNRHLAMAAFLTALARKARKTTVAEVIDEATCERLLRSFVSPEDLKAVA